ncbi:VWA domain-containing protein [Providencia rettgeri]|uniref:VWA domain-containing protein n=1 Tax=Providencia rettgeri TaxID=587 RepID=UPI0025520C95|nr:VWA domain-containing protein [Providencia rettgeri]MDK7744920.1 VWA domain-containing protein [Providencia rettgeri]MDK7758792.1 VWA domain-containing protein [Providencia rettgeri]
MNRVLRLTSDTQKADYSLKNQQELLALLTQYFPAKYQYLFAHGEQQPDGAIIWSTSVSGHPVSLSSLDKIEFSNNHRLLCERLNDIQTRANKLLEEKLITQEQHLLLKKASAFPDTESVYIINNQPVITWWPRMSPLAVPIPAPASIQPAALIAAAAAPDRNRWLASFGFLILLLLFVLLFSWLRGCFDPKTLPAVAENTHVEPAPKPIPESVLVPVNPLTPMEKCLQTEIQKHGRTDTRDNSVCNVKLNPPIRKVCPVNRNPQDAPQVLIIFDASYSMNMSMNLTKQQIDYIKESRKLFAGWDVEPRRINVAKKALGEIVKNIPNDTNIITIVAADCEKIQSTGNITPNNRSSLLSFIKRIEPDGGTPLADSITQANRSIKDNNRDTIIILISDGVESCEKDPCAAARALKRAHPKAVINVIDIMGSGAGNCVAQATGGKVFTATNTKDVAMMMEKAFNDYIPEGCN